jgi:hypothetical protein
MLPALKSGVIVVCCLLACCRHVQATLLLKDAYGRGRRQHLSEKEAVERAVGEVADLLWEDAYQVRVIRWQVLGVGYCATC